jgi:hypothetical protein
LVSPARFACCGTGWPQSISEAMLADAMERLLPTLLTFVFGFSLLLPASGQEALPEIDLLYPDFAHPQRDADGAIKHRDFRFITMDRIGEVVPGVERYPRLKGLYGMKLLKQHLHLFASASEKFSFDLRARAYAEQYNRTRVGYLLAHQRKKTQ